MTEVNFYHITQTPLEKCLPQLVTKIYNAGFKSLVIFKDQEILDIYNKLFWTAGRISFLPHASYDEAQSERQPVLLTIDDKNLNNANLKLIVGAAKFDNDNLPEKLLFIFNGNDSEELKFARQQYVDLKKQNFKIKYYQQTDKNGWVLKD